MQDLDDGSLADLRPTDEQPLLTLSDATAVLRIGRSLAYLLAREYSPLTPSGRDMSGSLSPSCRAEDRVRRGYPSPGGGTP